MPSDLINVKKVLDATSGDSSEFKSFNNLLTFKLTITGTPNANIKAFFIEQTDKSNKIFYLKLSCSDWNGASVSLKAKTTHSDDSFDDTNDIFTKNDLQIFDY